MMPSKRRSTESAYASDDPFLIKQALTAHGSMVSEESTCNSMFSHMSDPREIHRHGCKMTAHEGRCGFDASR
jgi:hypothetical protein